MDPELEPEALATDGLAIYVGKYENDDVLLWATVYLYADSITAQKVSEVTKAYVRQLFLDALESNVDATKDNEIYAEDYAILEEALEVIRPIVEEQYLSIAVTDRVSATTSRLKI